MSVPLTAPNHPATTPNHPATTPIPAKPVQVIQPSIPLPGSPARRPRTLRVAAYCRVSTDTKEQLTSYEAQRTHYTTYIADHPGWTLAGIFADEGISGTQARRRPEFLRMVAACEAGDIDLVITKSISRFARNTLDCLNYIRQLKELGIPVIFEKESINTMESSGEVLITILASLAQEESASISKNVKMGIRYVMQEGRGRVNYTRFMGYTQGPTKGSLVIVPAEADIIRRIYREYLEGYSPALIARHLEAAHVTAPAGGSRWHASTIASILRNEKYCGDLLLQKYFTQDYLTHKVVRNRGQLPQYFVEDHHEPIVPKQVFYQVQGERARRSRLRDDISRLRFGSRQALQGRLVCGLCGRALKQAGKAPSALWLCCDRVRETGQVYPQDDACLLPPVSDAEARAAVLLALNRLPELRHQLERLAKQLVAGPLRVVDLRIAHADKHVCRLRDATDGGETPASFGPSKKTARRAEQEAPSAENPQLAAAVAALDDLLAARAPLACREMQLMMLLELACQLSTQGARPTAPAPAAPEAVPAPACSRRDDFFSRTRYQVPSHLLDRDGHLKTFDDELVARYLDRITVTPRALEVVLKAGVSIAVPRSRRRLPLLPKHQ